MSEPICEVIITADDAGWLTGFTRSLITDRLVACGQHTPVRSLYRWEGAVHDEAETRVALHTRLSLVQAIIDRVLAEHPYDVPCVLAVPVTAANPAYAAWVVKETEPPEK